MKVTSFLLSGILVSWVLSVFSEEMIDLSPCNFPAIYNFGDSNSDTGGISAAFYPAGRPSAKHLKLPYLSAYLDSIGTSFRHGANFATRGAKIRRLNTSFFQSGESPFSLDIQIVQFDQFKARTSDLFTNAKRHSHRRNLPRPEDFSKALYTFDIGQNDIAVGIQSMSNEKFEAVIPDIVDQFAAAVQHLYQTGARTFWIHNTGPLGCLPVTLHYFHRPMPGILDKNGCVIAQNDMAKEFNRQLKCVVLKLREQLPDAALTYVDMFAAKYELIGSAKKQGFADARNICCGYHEDETHVYCGNKAEINGSEVYAGSCKDPSLYISWDGIHYTEAANQWIANHTLNGSFSDPPVPITHACHKDQYV